MRLNDENSESATQLRLALTNLGDLQTKNKSGKAAIRVQENAKVLIPKLIEDEKDVLAAISNQGRMLVFPHSELPQLARGKGNKIIGIPKANFEIVNKNF